MKSYQIQTFSKKILADTHTPVSVYLKLRDHFPNSLLLESSDYHANDNSYSYICCNPIASISIAHNQLIESFPDGEKHSTTITEEIHVPERIQNYINCFQTDLNPHKFTNNGLFGYIAHDAVQYFDSITIAQKKQQALMPDLYYALYQNVIAINHFNNEAHIFSHSYTGENNIAHIEQLLAVKTFGSYQFEKVGEKHSPISDAAYKEMVRKAKSHCLRGDVFQLVLSRRFTQSFKGDEFNVYRALRAINPSPYLFFFDYGDFKIFGSSPEAQLIVNAGWAEIHPIAGTFKRTGNDEKDAQAAIALSEDPKENAEHVMLVDLARNDLSRNGSMVEVKTNREVQFFSHVIHLVSKVIGKKKEDIPTFQIAADTFPAGTLSGGPKHKALQLIEKYEQQNRNFYGGAIGVMDFEGNFNHAIIIRSFFSQNHQLHYQAGAGIVAASDENNELNEVYNKLGALDKALETAQNIL